VQRLAQATTPQERKAVIRILSEYFKLLDDGWHNSRADKMLAKYEKSVPATTEKKNNVALRQARSRARREALFDALRKVGAAPSFNSTNYELQELCREHGLKPVEITKAAEVVTRDVTVTSRRDETTAQAPITNNQSSVTSRSLAVTAVEPEVLGGLARVLRKAGMATCNVQDPTFIALVQAGATTDELAVIATEATLKGKGWAWFLATVKGRRADKAAMAQQAPETYRQRANAAAVAAWTPELARKLP
jgi:uncharacterized protein YdaU (DUF1376 family)